MAVKKSSSLKSVLNFSAHLNPRTFISTGVLMLDMALLGGLSENQFHMFLGQKNSGKTTSMLLCAAEAQKKYPEKHVVIFDQEGSLSLEWAEKLGVDLERLQHVPSQTREEFYSLFKEFVKSTEISFIGVDSITTMAGKDDADSEEYSMKFQQNAKMYSELFKELLPLMAQNQEKYNHKVTILLLNQYRENMNAFGKFDTISVPGGKSLGYYTNVQVAFKNKEKLVSDVGILKPFGFMPSVTAYNEHTFDVKRQKHGNSLSKGDFRLFRLHCPDLNFIEGKVDNESDMLSTAKALGLHSGGGVAQFIEGCDIKFTSGDSIIQYLRDHPEFSSQFGAHLLRVHREKMRLPANTPDGYLFGGFYEE